MRGLWIGVVVGGCTGKGTGSDTGAVELSLADLAGDWGGTAVDDNGPAYAMVANFVHDPAASPELAGSLDLDGWVYEITSATVEGGVAAIELTNTLGARALSLSGVAVDEGAAAGNFVVDLCVAGGTTGTGCSLSGTFSLSEQ